MPTKQPTDTVENRDVYTVSRLNGEVRSLLETSFQSIWIEGEISNIARPASGHLYFSLKDENAQIRCAMFRGSRRRTGFTPEAGMAVLCHGRLGLYEVRGDYQLIVDHIEEAGEGLLQREFERLKKNLAAEGLFDSAIKKDLPRLPRRIGVVTSSTGAAVRDVIRVLARRFPAVPVVVYPVPVQGDGAADQIARAIQVAEQRSECDVLILTRGGGSLEDLWAFNEEVLARAIHACTIPVISGVGHEIDVTIADFVADVRAPTPSGAAEIAVPDQQEWLRLIDNQWQRINRAIRRQLGDTRDRTNWLARRMAQMHPGNRLRQQSQRLDELEMRLQKACKSRFERTTVQLASLAQRVIAMSPATAIREGRQRTDNVMVRLRGEVRRRLETARNRLQVSGRTLEAVGPMATLERGYAIVTNPAGSIVTNPAQVEDGERLGVKVARGDFTVEVTDPEKAQN